MDKPIKPNVDLPDSFGGVKNNFSTSKILNGYEKDVPDIFGGANINYMLDTLGKRQAYYDAIVDFINGLPIGQTITTDSNNKLVYDDLRVDLSGLANVDLSNLTATGENHFANKDLSNLTATGENHFTNKDLSNLTTTGEKHFINKTQVTNCILEAPNGVFTSNGATLTIKSGLKVLIPNGRNADGTLNNNEFTLNADVTYTYTYGVDLINEYIFIRADNLIERLNGNFVYYVSNYAQLSTQTGNNQYRIAYVENDNLWYTTSNTGTTWTSINMTPIGKLSVQANNTIYDLRPDYELSLSNSSLTSKTIINTPLALPSNWLYIDLTWSEASEIDLIAPANGYFELYRAAANDTDFICFTQVLSDGVTPGISTVSSSSRIDAAIGLVYLHINLPVQKGTLVKLTKRGTGAVNAFRFVFAKGDE